jgi:hypothetical protein
MLLKDLCFLLTVDIARLVEIISYACIQIDFDKKMHYHLESSNKSIIVYGFVSPYF